MHHARQPRPLFVHPFFPRCEAQSTRKKKKSKKKKNIIQINTYINSNSVCVFHYLLKQPVRDTNTPYHSPFPHADLSPVPPHPSAALAAQAMLPRPASRPPVRQPARACEENNAAHRIAAQHSAADRHRDSRLFCSQPVCPKQVDHVVAYDAPPVDRQSTAGPRDFSGVAGPAFFVCSSRTLEATLACCRARALARARGGA
ncbi:hypothetical protein IWX49DRAFT_104359 [Phyllosticta citricarpa]|uniref:Uncharacterized protein n=1 Tax=Phyllosticta citricarpa TaxID=55181 RepID=A0ABR1MMY8_9PEZI